MGHARRCTRLRHGTAPTHRCPPLPCPPQADRQCCEDNPDALTHHEVLLPGHLLLKFLREQLETALDAFKSQVCAVLCCAALPYAGSCQGKRG